VSISHEALFEAWPSLREYVAANKKQLMDQTLLESRAGKWVEMGKPWSSGLASGREYKDFRHAMMTATPVTKEYLRASLRARWIQTCAIGVLILLLGGTGTWLWRESLTLDQAILRLQSKFMSIDLAPAMQLMPVGTFEQGDTHGKDDLSEKPLHRVTVKPFAIGQFEVTFEEYDRFAIATGRLPLPRDGGWGRGHRPVINVSWQDAKDYADWLSRQTGKQFRLPTEAEWEYAARSGGKDQIWAGTSHEERLAGYAVYLTDRTAPVGQKKSNDLGLYDMSGNVWEWTEDCWHHNYEGAPTDGSAWLEVGVVDCGQRMIRGGSWAGSPEFLRGSHRLGNVAEFRDDDIGFRLAQDIP
jgi:formylglycine-generating enzyme required for sulfatase activity